MMLRRAIVVLAALMALPAFAAEEFLGTYVRFTGTGTNDNDVVITTSDMDQWSVCEVTSRTGAVDVFIDPDGAGFLPYPYRLQDMNGTDVTDVLVTTAGKSYAFVFKAKYVRVLQNGATATNVVMNCWKQGA